MKKNLKYYLLAAAVMFAVGASLVSCSDDGKYARLEVWLTDEPGDYDEVNVDIQDVQVHSEAGEQTSGWISLNVNNGVYNLLELTNGLDTLLGSAQLPVGKISQIRLVLGDNNTLKIGDEVYDLNTPSSQQSGLKLNVHATLTEGITYVITLDFDAAKSVVETGSGKYNLKPVIRSISTATSGAIDGTVTLPESSPAVWALMGTDTVESAFADSVTGKFLLRGLPAGNYTVTFSPDSGFVIDPITDVDVEIGIVTHLGDIVVTEQ
jgi:hypothetical protein